MKEVSFGRELVFAAYLHAEHFVLESEVVLGWDGLYFYLEIVCCLVVEEFSAG